MIRLKQLAECSQCKNNIYENDYVWAYQLEVYCSKQCLVDSLDADHFCMREGDLE